MAKEVDVTKRDKASQVYERLRLEAHEHHQKQIDGAADTLCPKISQAPLKAIDQA